jgi:hypothetical protein
LIEKEITQRRWRVQFAGSVDRQKVVTCGEAISTKFSTECVEEDAGIENLL